MAAMRVMARPKNAPSVIASIQKPSTTAPITPQEPSRNDVSNSEPVAWTGRRNAAASASGKPPSRCMLPSATMSRAPGTNSRRP